MTIPLLTTKLHIPTSRPSDRVVPRPHLIRRLDEGLRLGCRLTMVSASAGFGKTTLLAAWLGEMSPDRVRTGWLSLDENDNDPTRFFLYMVGALQHLAPDVGHAVGHMLQSYQPVALETIISVVVNDLAALAENMLLVVDDYHLITNPTVHEAITFLLHNMPPNLHLVIASRIDPPLPLPQLRARGQMTELRDVDLRFTLAETTDLFNQVLGFNLNPTDIEALEQRTEGWIAGLHLAALALQRIADEAEQVRFVRTFRGSHRYVLDYLVDEVLARQPPEVQTFLYQTTWLERFCAPLCDAVRFGSAKSLSDSTGAAVQSGSAKSPSDSTGTASHIDSQAILAMLERSNLFIIPLDDERHWYRYHRLFADLLRARAGDDADEAERHRRAAGWYQEHGLIGYAFEHWIRASDFAKAATLVETGAMAHLYQGQTTLVLTWIDRLPTELVADRPWLLIFRAWGLLLTGVVTSIPECLQQAELAGARADAALEMAGHVAAIRAYVAALGGDVPTAIAQAQQAMIQLKPDDLAVRSVVTFVLAGMRLLAGEVATARIAFTEAAQIGQAADNRHLAVPAWCATASLQVIQGQLRQAEATYRKALDLALTPEGRPLPLAARPYDGLAQLAYEQNDLAAAGEWLAKSLELCKQWPKPEASISSLLTQATLCLAQGDLEAASAACEEATAIADSVALDPLSQSLVAAKWQEFLLMSGHVTTAARLAADRNLTVDDPISFFREAEHIALARILLAQGRPGEAQALVARLISAAQNDGRSGSLIKLLALQAVACQAQHQTDKAMLSLEHALSLGEAEGFVRSVVDQGHPLATLLAGLPPTPYRDMLLAACNEGPVGGAPVVFGQLSERELEVLGLMAAGLGNQAIADELVVALGTVKAHAATIYRKLDVNSRTQAVARARDLGIMP